MSTKSSNEKKTLNPWDELLSFKNQKEEDKHEAQMLAFRFLSEVEKYQELQGMKKKELAKEIGTSASYITQLFRGNKPLNFETIAKMQRALHICFHISAKPATDEMKVDETIFLSAQCRYKTDSGYWMWKNINADKDKYNTEFEKDIIYKAAAYYDDKAIPA